MYVDPLTPYSLAEAAVFFFGIFLLILVPGREMYRLLETNAKPGLEQTVFSFALGYLALHILAYLVFLFRTNILLYAYEAGCAVCLVRLALELFWKKNTTDPAAKIPQEAPNKPDFIYIGAYSLLIGAIVYIYSVLPHLGMFKVEGPGQYGFLAPWDDIDQTGVLNELRNFFVPIDDPYFPGFPPIYFNYLGLLIPSLLVKSLGMDQMHVIFFWSPLFYYMALVLLIPYLAKQFGADKWSALFSAGFLFLFPKFFLGYLPETTSRHLGGQVVILCTIFFMKKYFDTRRTAYLVLTFSWALLYTVKGNYLVALFPGVVAFYALVLFRNPEKKWSGKTFATLCLCALFPLALVWISRTLFGSLFLPAFLVFQWTRFWNLATAELVPLTPALLVFGYHYWKKFRARQPISPMEIFFWCSFLSLLLFASLASNVLDGGAPKLMGYALIIALPIVAEKLFPARLYRSVGVACLVLFALAIPIQKFEENSEYFPVTEDEVEVGRFLRTQTPPDSVFIHNMYRYIDRPALLSALGYRKAFINESERHSDTSQTVNEQRVYEYWDFHNCACSGDDQRYFFSKFKKLDYFVEYDPSFLKAIKPIIGMPSINAPFLPVAKDPAVFQEVFRRGQIAIYKINRQP